MHQLLHNPPPNPTLELVTFDMAKEFFRNPQLVKALVQCFDTHQIYHKEPCPYDGLALLIGKNIICFLCIVTLFTLEPLMH